jgi:hypothetical protein
MNFFGEVFEVVVDAQMSISSTLFDLVFVKRLEHFILNFLSQDQEWL